MDPTIEVKERVDVVAVYHRRGDPNSLCMPCKMRWRGREIEFVELAQKHPTTAGKRMIHVFHVYDGATGYRLEFDSEALTWTLIAIMPELP